MIGAMKIRKARPADAAAIAAFNTRLAWETEKLRLNPATVRRGVRALLKDAAKGTYFVAQEGRSVIGQLLVTREWSDWRNGEFWWIQSVYVAAGFRRRGVLSALFARVNNLARSRRGVRGLRLYVEKNNRRAQRAYDRLGMAKTRYAIYESVPRRMSIPDSCPTCDTRRA
jgi:ribosomal protein S18 acetylase RimI-like enzyme